MNFSSTTTLIGLIIAAVLLDAGFMLWLRRRKNAARPENGVRVLGQYSPLLTRLRRLPAVGRTSADALAHPVDLLRRLGEGILAVYSGLRELIRGHAAAVRTGLMLAASTAALAGQIFFFRLHDAGGGWPWLAAAAVLWLAACLPPSGDEFGPAPPSPSDPPAYLIRRGDLRLIALILSVQTAALGVYQYWNRPVDYYHWDIFSLWLISQVLLGLSFCPVIRRPRWLPLLLSRWKAWLPFLLLTLAAAGLRFYQLGRIPVIMENDEGILGMQVERVLGGLIRNMFEVYGGYGTLYFFVQAVPVWLFGHTQLALRLITALAGALTIPLAAWAGWRMFGYRAALASAALLTASHLHIQFSRVSPSASSFDPLFSLLLVPLLYEGLTRSRPWWWAAAGAVMGLGMYFYVGARVMLLITLAVFLGMLILRRDLLRAALSGLFPLAAAYLVTAAPMLSWGWRYPHIFNERLNQVGIFQNGWLAYEMGRYGQSAFEVLAEQFGNALLIFNYHPARWFYQAEAPILGLIGGLLLLFGLIYSLTRLKSLPFLLVSAWFWVTLISGQVLVLDPSTNAYRTLGLLPAAFLMMAAAALLLADRLGTLWPRHARALAAVLLAALIAVEAGWNVAYYFGDWAPKYRYGDANTQRASLIGAFLAEQPPAAQVFVAGSDAFRPAGWSALEFLKGSTPYIEVSPPLAKTVPALHPSPQAVVIVPASETMQAELERLRARYPSGTLTAYTLGGKLYFWSFTLNGE